MYKKIIVWVKNKVYNIEEITYFLRAYNSPFRPPRVHFYIGKIALGVPYFFPRVWRRLTEEEAVEAATVQHNKNHHTTKLKLEHWLFDYRRRVKPVPKKIGFDLVPMRWKTKWSNADYRFETNPIWSFVIYKLQIAVYFTVPEDPHYWECFLFYNKNTDKSKTRRDRIKEAKKGFPCVWSNSEGEICYWDLILKSKYL